MEKRSWFFGCLVIVAQLLVILFLIQVPTLAGLSDDADPTGEEQETNRIIKHIRSASLHPVKCGIVVVPSFIFTPIVPGGTCLDVARHSGPPGLVAPVHPSEATACDSTAACASRGSGMCDAAGHGPQTCRVEVIAHEDGTRTCTGDCCGSMVQAKFFVTCGPATY